MPNKPRRRSAGSLLKLCGVVGSLWLAAELSAAGSLWCCVPVLAGFALGISLLRRRAAAAASPGRAWKRLLLSLTTLLLGLGAVELYLQLSARAARSDADPESGRPLRTYFYTDADGCVRIRPSVVGTSRSFDDGPRVEVAINASGFPGPDPDPEADATIVFVGDSVTFNGGVPYEATFVSLVAAHLSRVDADRSWQCFNLGLNDTGVREYARKVKHHALALRPDCLVIGLYLNDARPPQGFLGEDGRTVFSDLVDGVGLGKLELTKWIRRRWMAWYVMRGAENTDRFRWTARYGSPDVRSDPAQWQLILDEARYDWGAAWEPSSWDVIRTHLEEIRDLAADAGCPVLLVCFPVSLQLHVTSAPENLTYPQEQARRLAGELSLPFLDVLPALQAAEGEILYRDQCHLTTAGNRVVANAIGAWLQEELVD